MRVSCYFMVFFVFTSFYCFSQSNTALDKIKDFSIKYTPRKYDSTVSYTNLRPGGNLQYLYPLYQLFRQESKFRELETDNGYYDNMSESLSFLEDYQSSLEYQQKKYETLTESSIRQINKAVADLKDIQHADARKYISFLAQHYQVIMMNESYEKSLHRAFAHSLLQDLYKKGFRYLCLEMLYPFSNKPNTGLNASTGFYTNEPIAGELVRKALELGFTLVSYEDSAAKFHSATQRDSVQASNIFSILQKDPQGKIFVYASYGHISKKALGNDYIPMGLAFKKLSGIDPLCIDQTDMTEGGEFAYGKALYQTYISKFMVTFPSIPLLNNQPVNITNNENYDLIIVHPPTAYRDGRPTWLSLDGERHTLYIKPTVPDVFLAQAYYLNETKMYGPGLAVPADQTYIQSGKGNFLFYLKKGKYLVTFRDISYRLIGKLNIQVD